MTLPDRVSTVSKFVYFLVLLFQKCPKDSSPRGKSDKVITERTMALAIHQLKVNQKFDCVTTSMLVLED